MKIALVSMEVIPGRPDRNTANMRKKIAEAKAAGADLALFPALSLSGLFLGTVWKQPAFLRDCAAYAEEIAAAAEGITVIFGNAAEDTGCTGVTRTLLERRTAHSPSARRSRCTMRARVSPRSSTTCRRRISSSPPMRVPTPSASARVPSLRLLVPRGNPSSTSIRSACRTRARLSTLFRAEHTSLMPEVSASFSRLPTQRA